MLKPTFSPRVPDATLYAARRALDLHIALMRVNTDMLLKATRDSLGGSKVTAITAELHRLDNRCVSCTVVTSLIVDEQHPLAIRGELGHIIAASSYAPSGLRCGYVGGNLALMCHTCNIDAKDTDFTAKMLRLPQNVLMVLPVVERLKREKTDIVEEIRANRDWS